MDTAASVLYKLLVVPSGPSAGIPFIDVPLAVVACLAMVAGTAAVLAARVRHRDVADRGASHGSRTIWQTEGMTSPPPRPLDWHYHFGSSALRTARRAAAMFSDAVGFSLAMDHDEKGTLTGLNEDLRLIAHECDGYGGTVLKTVGDGVVAIFEDGAAAVGCACAIQARMAGRRAGRGERLRHRIGIHLGKVFTCGGEVMGVTVNVAARLEKEAPSGGVCVSRQVIDACGGVPPGFESRGVKALRNMREAVGLFVLPPHAAASNVIPFPRRGLPVPWVGSFRGR